MINYKRLFNISASAIVLLGALFGNIPGGRAQAGGDWTTPVNLSLSGLASDPILFMDFQGKLNVIWTDNGVKYKYSQSVDNGATWSKPQTASFPFVPKGPAPKLIGDASGAIHIFWIDQEGSLYYGQTTPANLIDAAHWQTNRRLAGNVLDYDVSLDSRNALQLVYIQNAGGVVKPAGIYYMHTAPGGAGWSDSVNLYSSDYFRSARASEAFLRIAVSNVEPVQDIYVAWDSRAQKRVFMARSVDGGINWAPAEEIKGPQDTGGVDAPFNLNVAAAGSRVLLVWQTGEPGSGKCSVSSQWSTDRGHTWGEIVTIPSASTDCPEISRFIGAQDDYMIIRLTGQGDPILLAWDGTRWSDPENQVRLPTLSNPLTFDAILLGCRFDLFDKDRLYVVGCDQARGGDAWFLSRRIQPVKDWFAPMQAWSAPALLAGDSVELSSLTSVADTQGTLHSVWAQTRTSSDGRPINTIEYAQWNGALWSKADAVVSGLNSAPVDLNLTVNGTEKLLLSWVDELRGEVLFSWANLGRAGLASEWSTATGLPAPSSLVSSPDMIVDGSNRIVVVYAVPLNENRGIYTVQSTDSGQTWSTPVAIFDAVAVKWDEVNDPRIGLDRDGGLHVIFQRSSARSGESLGLFYSRSLDGGTTWSEPQIMSESNVRWSEIVTNGRQLIHVMWQEYDGLVYANLSQLSRDGGQTWGKPYSITGVNDSPTPVAASMDIAGNIHFMQLLRRGGLVSVKQDDLTLQDWAWDGSNWTFASDCNLSLPGEGLHYSLAAGIASSGSLQALVLAGYSDRENKIRDEILALGRYLGGGEVTNPGPAAIIPTPMVVTVPTELPHIQPTQAVDPAVLNDDSGQTTANRRNLVGVVIIGSVLLIAALLLFRGRPTQANK